MSEDEYREYEIEPDIDEPDYSEMQVQEELENVSEEHIHELQTTDEYWISEDCVNVTFKCGICSQKYEGVVYKK